MRISLLLLFSCCISVLCAQTAIDNHDDEIMNMKGKWSRGENLNDGLDKDLPVSQNVQLYKRIDSLLALLKTAYPNPIGLEAIQYSSIRQRPIGTGTPSAYSHTSLYKSYFYSPVLKKMLLDEETHTWLNMHVNYFGWFLENRFGRYVVDNKEVTVFALMERDGTWNGYPLFKKYRGRSERAVVISRDGELPYIPITQKQFLTFLRKDIEALRKKFLKSDSGYHSYLLKQIETARTGKHANEAAREKAIKTAEYYYEEYKKRRATRGPLEEAEYLNKLKNIDDYLASHTEAEMAQPVKTPSMGDFNGNFESRGKNGKLYELVRINFAYFKKELPRYVPQFFVLYWTWDDTNNAPAAEFKRQLEENFPIKRLKALLDK
jgi:hypothetical protein